MLPCLLLVLLSQSIVENMLLCSLFRLDLVIPTVLNAGRPDLGTATPEHIARKKSSFSVTL